MAFWGHYSELTWIYIHTLWQGHKESREINWWWALIDKRSSTYFERPSAQSTVKFWACCSVLIIYPTSTHSSLWFVPLFLALTMLWQPNALLTVTTTQLQEQLISQSFCWHFNTSKVAMLLPQLGQYVTILWHLDRTLDLCFNIPGAYVSKPCPSLGFSDHKIILLQPKYRQKLKMNKVNSKTIQVWNNDYRAADGVVMSSFLERCYSRAAKVTRIY